MLTDKRILVTGATGQIAATIARHLARTNEVWAVARFGKPGSEDALHAAGIRTHRCDFTTGDFEGLRDDFDYVIHSAASAHPKTYEEGMVANAEGTGFLMTHCRKARGFLHVSTTGVYAQNPDPYHVYPETDPLGGCTHYNMAYCITKIAAEGVVRTLARTLGLPATIARVSTAYGGIHDDGGLTGLYIDKILAHQPIRMPKICMRAPVHEDDMCAHVEPLLAAASVPATIVNWGGDIAGPMADWVRYIGALVGIEPVFDDDESSIPSLIVDSRLRRALGCTITIGIADGISRQIRLRHPELKLNETAWPGVLYPAGAGSF